MDITHSTGWPFGDRSSTADCLRVLLAADREAPEETHARPAVRALVSGLLVTGRTSPGLRELAQRCGIT